MQIHSDIRQFPQSARGGALTVGKFDGVHLGHQRILQEACDLAKKLKGSLSVMTFHPHPSEALHPEKVHERLMDREDLISQMEKCGVDVLIVQNFDAEFAAQSSEKFLENLSSFAALKGLVAGPDFRYGHGQGGTVQDLNGWAKSAGVILKRVPRVQVEGEDISSTAIKRLLKEHNFSLTEKMLGRKYYLRGEVIRGEGRGKTIGVPTANFIPTITVPLTAGVYAGWAWPDQGGPKKAVMNVGHKPTFWRDHTYPLTFECHILQWDGDLYGQTLCFQPQHYLRQEKKFSGAPELKAQIQLDLQQAEKALS